MQKNLLYLIKKTNAEKLPEFKFNKKKKKRKKINRPITKIICKKFLPRLLQNETKIHYTPNELIGLQLRHDEALEPGINTSTHSKSE